MNFVGMLKILKSTLNNTRNLVTDLKSSSRVKFAMNTLCCSLLDSERLAAAKAYLHKGCVSSNDVVSTG